MNFQVAERPENAGAILIWKWLMASDCSTRPSHNLIACHSERNEVKSKNLKKLRDASTVAFQAMADYDGGLR